jgi:hypothetical protein
MILTEESENKILRERGFDRETIYFNNNYEKVKIESFVNFPETVLVDNLDYNTIEEMKLSELKKGS